MDTRTINIITLAYLGDAVYEVYVRKFLIDKKIAFVEDLQSKAINYVSAKNQNKILNYLLENNILNDNEIDIIKRGRNYKRGSHPKNTDIVTYKNSTGFEALIGYLYLEDKKRMEELITLILEEFYEKNI